MAAINAENIKMLKTTLVQVNAAAKQVKKDIAADPKKLGELAGKGLSLNQVEDAVPIGLSMRAARALLETVIALAGDDGATGSPVVDAAGDQSAKTDQTASEVSGAGESNANDEEVSHGAPTYVQVAKGGNRKQRRAAAKGKGPAVV